MKKATHILVIRLSALGDVAMTVPVLRVLTSTYPDLKITVLSKKFNRPLFEGLPNVTFLEAEVTKRHKGIFGLLRLAKEIRAMKVDAVADLHNVLRSKIISRRLSWSGIVSATVDKGREEKKNLVRAQGKTLLPLKSTHRRYADVFEKLGFPIDLEDHRFPERSPLTPRLSGIMGKEPKKCVGVAPLQPTRGSNILWSR